MSELYILEEFENRDKGWIEANSPYRFDDYVEALHEAYHKSKHNAGVYRVMDVDDEDATVCLMYCAGRKFTPVLMSHDGRNRQIEP